MERHDRAPVATFFAAAPFVSGERVALTEGAAHHARVKRLGEGDVVQLTDGRGRRAIGRMAAMAKKDVAVDIEFVEDAAPLRAIHLRVPIADRDRMLWLAEKSTELGISSWQAVRFRRSASVSPRGEGDAFGEKVRARMISALEQSGGAWLPVIVSDTSVEQLISNQPLLPIVLDVGGKSLESLTENRRDVEPTILVGPEGGIEASELSMLVDAGWSRVRLAQSVLRFETAGIAAVATLRAMETTTED